MLLAKLVRSRWLDISRVLFGVLMEKQTKERGQYLDILTEQAWSKRISYIKKKTDYALVRIKNDFFTSRAAGKKPDLFVPHETHGSTLCFLCFDCLLSLFATPLPKLSYELR